MSKRQIKAVLFDLDQTLLDRTASLKSFVDWQARGMLRSQVSDRYLFVKRFIFSVIIAIDVMQPISFAMIGSNYQTRSGMRANSTPEVKIQHQSKY